MHLTLTRFLYRPDGIFGRLCDDSNHQVAVTLEHAYGDPDSGFIPKVPPGTYTCVRYDSPERGYQVWMLQDVPGASYIEMHIGNFNKDSKGCILLGTATVEGMIINSQVAFHSFMDLTKDETTLTLEVA